MPTPEREVRPQPPQVRPTSVSAVSMKVSMTDLLASCAAATAVSTPPREWSAESAPQAEPPARREAA